MVLAFKTRDLRSLCESEAVSKRLFGTAIASDFNTRLNELRAAANVKELIVGSPRMLSDSARGLFEISFRKRFHITFEANHTNNPLTQDGKIDWDRVSRIQILCAEEK